MEPRVLKRFTFNPQKNGDLQLFNKNRKTKSKHNLPLFFAGINASDTSDFCILITM